MGRGCACNSHSDCKTKIKHPFMTVCAFQSVSVLVKDLAYCHEHHRRLTCDVHCFHEALIDLCECVKLFSPWAISALAVRNCDCGYCACISANCCSSSRTPSILNVQIQMELLFYRVI